MLLTSLLASNSAFASCVPDSIRNGKAALVDVPAERRVELTAKTLKMACNWPRDIELALVGVFQAPPEYQPSIDLTAAKDYPELWDRVCIGGRRVLDHAVNLQADEARAYIYTECGVERTRFATQAEFVAADGPFLLPLMIMAVLDSLRNGLRIAPGSLTGSSRDWRPGTKRPSRTAYPARGPPCRCPWKLDAS